MTQQRRPQPRKPAGQGSAPEPVAEVTVAEAKPQELAVEDAPSAATDTPQDPLFRVSADTLRTMLRLAPGVRITGAVWNDGMLELRVNAPGMPADAVELLVSYRRTGGSDPVWPVSTWRRAEPGKAAS